MFWLPHLYPVAAALSVREPNNQRPILNVDIAQRHTVRGPFHVQGFPGAVERVDNRGAIPLHTLDQDVCAKDAVFAGGRSINPESHKATSFSPLLRLKPW